MYLILQRAKDIQRHDDGAPWTWKSDGTIAEFKDGQSFIDYVQSHIKELKNAAVFTGSASLIVGANGYLGEQLKKAGVI